MANMLHVLVDASAGMRAAGKLRLCLAAASAIRRCGSEAYGLYLHMPPVRVWRFAAEVTTPFRPSLPATGTASLAAISLWFEERRAESPPEEPTLALLFSDGLFEDFTELDRLGAWLRGCPTLRVAVVGVGPDRDTDALAKLSGNGCVWTIGELDAALRELLGPPPDEGGMEDALAPFWDETDDEEMA